MPKVLSDRRWVGLICLTIFAFGQAATMVVAAFATRGVITAVRGEQVTVPLTSLVTLAVAGATIFALRSLEAAVAEATGQSYATAIRRTLFIHLSRTPISVVNGRRAGAMALRYVGDLSSLKGWVSKGIARLITAIVTIPAAFVVLYVLHPILAAGAAVPIITAILVILWLGNPLGTAHKELRSRRARLAAAMAERIPQGLALRRSGRMSTELKALSERSRAIAHAATYRAWLSETVRALPDVASGIAGAICLYICLELRLSVEDAVASLTALALIVWPLRRLADVRDRQKAYTVAAQKLEATLSNSTIKTSRRKEPIIGSPALELTELCLNDNFAKFSLSLQNNQVMRLEGVAGSGKSRVLTIAAGFERANSGETKVLGLLPSAVQTGRVLYLGRYAPQLKGTLRRDCTLGIGRYPDDCEIEDAIKDAGLTNLLNRLGGLSGKVAEGRRNLTSTEITGILLVRGLLSNPDLALIDANEIGLSGERLSMLIDHLRNVNSAVLVVTNALQVTNSIPKTYCLPSLEQSDK